MITITIMITTTSTMETTKTTPCHRHHHCRSMLRQWRAGWTYDEVRHDATRNEANEATLFLTAYDACNAAKEATF
jgi:hypothetical protein